MTKVGVADKATIDNIKLMTEASISSNKIGTHNTLIPFINFKGPELGLKTIFSYHGPLIINDIILTALDKSLSSLFLTIYIDGEKLFDVYNTGTPGEYNSCGLMSSSQPFLNIPFLDETYNRGLGEFKGFPHNNELVSGVIRLPQPLLAKKNVKIEAIGHYSNPDSEPSFAACGVMYHRINDYDTANGYPHSDVIPSTDEQGFYTSTYYSQTEKLLTYSFNI